MAKRGFFLEEIGPGPGSDPPGGLQDLLPGGISLLGETVSDGFGQDEHRPFFKVQGVVGEFKKGVSDLGIHGNRLVGRKRPRRRRPYGVIRFSSRRLSFEEYGD